MKTKFGWYLRPTETQLSEIWKSGILTVDANVLLDLYRYHESTRKSLLDSIIKFDGKKWLSFQASSEFFRNRTKVIISSSKTFKQALDEIEKLKSSLESASIQLKGNRIIPSEISSSLKAEISPIIEKSKEAIRDAEKNYPNFISEDPILAQLSAIFESSIGDGFDPSEIDTLNTEAERRQKEQIPPGYLDRDKDGDRPYGDFYLWRQILDHAKKIGSPIIFVTSERKDDWWETISGRTTGPRPELLKEAFEYSGQKIVIYQTDQFLEYASKKYGQQINADAIEEIRTVENWRTNLEPAVQLLSQNVSTFTDSKNSGTITIELKRSVKNFTASGHLEPNLLTSPVLEVKMTKSPHNLPQYRLGAGSGTTYDFNIHLKSIDYQTYLPAGIYTFEYEARSIIEVIDAELQEQNTQEDIETPLDEPNLSLNSDLVVSG